MSIPVNISASRGAAILGISKWKTQVQAWLEIMEKCEPGFCKKNNYEIPKFEYNTAMKWGHAFENAIIELSEKKQDCRIFDREKFYKKNYITCHIDGKYANTIPSLHEGKTTSEFHFKENFGEQGTDKIPIEYQIQVQHQMICTGAERVILSVLVFPKRPDEWEATGYQITDPDNHDYKIISPDLSMNVYPESWARILDQMGYFHQYEIEPNEKLQKLMIEKYTKFWEKNILKQIPPEPKTYDDIRALLRDPVGTIIADENVERMMTTYKMIKDEISPTGHLAKHAEQIKVEVLKYMNEKEKISDDDSTNKWILRDRSGKKIASYARDKRGIFIFR